MNADPLPMLQELHRRDAIFVPDGRPLEQVAWKVSHAAIVSHFDDAEFGCFDAIAENFIDNSNGFVTITVTNGAGSPRGQRYASMTMPELIDARWREQKAAAIVGRYAAAIRLNYDSSEVKADAKAKQV